ncbi:MAG TPA: chemotaxis protein CheW [Kineosporiaceae bacterium]|nr:chemotaxis protein CheW [Kineosporiaceae bacterium]
MSETQTETARSSAASAHGAPGDGAARYLTFTLQGELYALDIQEITEIIEFRSLTVVPMMPPFIRGVLNLRGRVLPVVDLAARFGQSATTVARRTGIIVVQSARGAEDGSGSELASGIGIMVDGVNKVVHLGDDDMEPPPSFGVGIRSDFISGMAKHEGGFIIVLDVGKVLSVDDMVMVGNAAALGEELVTAAAVPA